MRAKNRMPVVHVHGGRSATTASNDASTTPRRGGGPTRHQHTKVWQRRERPCKRGTSGVRRPRVADAAEPLRQSALCSGVTTPSTVAGGASTTTSVGVVTAQL